MFPLYDQTRRQICMAAFLGLCVLPTLAVTGWSIARHTSWHRQAEEQRLGYELGLDVTVGALKHLTPGVVRYEDLKLSDPETGQCLLQCAAVDATWTSMTDSHDQQRPAIVLAVSQADCEAASWLRLSEVLRRRLECRDGRPEIEVRLSADQFTLHNAAQSHALENVEGGIGLTPGGIQARLSFRLSGGTATEPIQMRIVRNRQVSPPSNGFDLDTRRVAVPCRLLALFDKDLQSLGPDCRFSGTVSSYETASGWYGDLSGQLLGVDLAQVACGRTIDEITGTADVTVKRAKFLHGRLEEMDGWILAGPGTLGNSTVESLTAHLGISRATELASGNPSLSFDRLGVQFWLDSRGVTLAGCCDEKSGAVAVSGGRVLLGSPPSQSQPIAALIQALVPVSSAPANAVPATRQSSWLSQMLPMPNAAAGPQQPASRGGENRK